MQCSEYTGTVLMESYKFMNKSYVNVNSTWTKSEILMYSKYSHSSMFQENYWESEQRLFLGWGYTNERLHFPCSLSCTGEGNGNPLQCSCLENPRDRGASWATVSGVAQSRTRLKRLSSSVVDFFSPTLFDISASLFLSILFFMIKKISQSLKKSQLHLACMMKYQV